MTQIFKVNGYLFVPVEVEVNKEGFRCFGKRSNLRLFNTTFHCLQINNNLWLAAFGR